MDFNVTYRPEQRDYYLFSLHHSKRRVIIIPLIAVLIFSALYLWALLNVGLNGMPDSLNTLFIVYLVFMVAVMPFINILLLKAASRKQYRTSMHTDFTLKLGEEGLNYHSAFGDSKLPWMAIYRASESESAVYLYISSVQAVIIPKRFMSPEQLETLRTFCRTNLSPKKCRLK